MRISNSGNKNPEDSSRKKGGIRTYIVSLTEEQKRYVKSDNESLMELHRWHGFEPQNWTADYLVRWIAERVDWKTAQDCLTEEGFECAHNIYSNEHLPIKEWALSTPAQ